jgi:hypothetical protein
VSAGDDEILRRLQVPGQRLRPGVYDQRRLRFGQDLLLQQSRPAVPDGMPLEAGLHGPAQGGPNLSERLTMRAVWWTGAVLRMSS